MLDILDNLRRKPLYVRRYIALGTTTLLSLLIFAIWANSWGVKDILPENTYTKTESPVAVVVQKASGAKDGILSALSNAREHFTQISATIASSVVQEEAVYQPNTDEKLITPENAPNEDVQEK